MKKYRIFEKYFLNTFFSVPFWLGCILTTLTCYLTLQFQADYRASAVFEFRMIHDKAQSFLTLIPGVYGAALVYYRDIKDQNYKNVVSRIPLRTYVRTQTVVCAACTWLISALGNMLFIVTYGNVYGWYDVREDAVMLNELFRGFLPEHMMSYFFVVGDAIGTVISNHFTSSADHIRRNSSTGDYLFPAGGNLLFHGNFSQGRNARSTQSFSRWNASVSKCMVALDFRAWTNHSGHSDR